MFFATTIILIMQQRILSQPILSEGRRVLSSFELKLNLIIQWRMHDKYCQTRLSSVHFALSDSPDTDIMYINITKLNVIQII
jgi:hypothetical protein